MSKHLFSKCIGNLIFSCKTYLLIFLIILSVQANAQLVINEISTNNQTSLIDEDGDHEDWIELYNAGSSAINLNGYSLIDKLPAPTQWSFPIYILQPGEFLLVHASGKNKKEVVHHWETAVNENHLWKYLKPTAEPAANWKLSSFNDASWTTGKGGIGYGDGDDSTVISTPANSLFMRKTFVISDTSKISKAVFHMDYDDGFVAYLNGVEIARSTNLSGNPPGYNGQADVEREAVVYSGGAYEKFALNKDLLKNILVNGTNVLSVQVHNTSAFSSDLTSRPNLSFAIKDASVLFSPTPVWFTESKSSFHTNFKLSKDGGETIYLFNNSSILLDQKDIPVIGIDHSFGRNSDGNANWSFFKNPTPGTTNSASTQYSGYCSNNLVFSLEGGFYTSTQTLTISGGSGIRYTTDGSLPTMSSSLYSGPISIPTTTVIRAACMSATLLPEKIFTNTYFINEPSTLPVVSISTNPENFFDDNIGIYKLGPNADSNTIPYFGANFWQDWERPIHIEYFDKDQQLGFEQDAGVKIFGNYSRSNPMKSLWIKAHDRYGKDRIDYQLFEDKNINQFKEFILRNSGNDFNITHMKDAVNQMRVFRKTDIDIQAYQPCVVFINGEYWGVHQVREKFNEHYVQQNYGLDENDIDVIDTWGGALHGENDLWGLWWAAITLDLTNHTNFKIIADSFDLDNMIDYFAAQIYISNWDWPQNNLKMWRSKTDRKYRYMMYDTDITLGIWGLQPANFNQMGRIKNAGGLTTGPHSEIFSKMLNYTPFRNAFINRSADLMNTIYTPVNFTNLAYGIRDTLAPEMPKHFAKWGSNTTAWAWNITDMVDFMNSRPAFARNQIESEFSLVKQVDVTLNVTPAGAGIIKINTIYPDTYPWTGVYFDGVPVTITAIPNPGYNFSHWQSPNLIPTPNTNKSVTLNVNLDQTFTAYFAGSASALQLTVSEVNYNSHSMKDAGDWFELHNKGNAPLDISKWMFQDYQDYHWFEFPDNIIIPAGGYLVVCSDATKFTAAYPDVNNYIGSFDFNLSNENDMIRLYNYKGDKIISFTYSNQAPWPANPDGNGYTLELIEGSANLNASSSWMSGCLYGSPGEAPDPSCVLSNFDRSDLQEFFVSPNPSSGIFKISIPSNHSDIVKYQVESISGISIKEGEILLATGEYSFDLDLSDLPSGIYILSLIQSNKKSVKRLVKF